MHMRMITLPALILQLSLGTVCMMQLAHAAMPQETHEQSMEAYTGMHDARSTAEAPAESADCGSGECLMHAAPAETKELGLTTTPDVVHRVTMLPVWQHQREDSFKSHPSTAPPFLLYTQTIVLRC